MKLEDMTEEEKIAYTAELRQRAESLGLTVHHKAGADTIAKQISTFYEEQEALKQKEAKDSAAKNPQSAKLAAIRSAYKMVRVRITSRNPMKKDYEGEIFAAGNSMVPTIKRYIPYDTEWHVEQILLNVIKEKSYQQFYTEKAPNGQSVRRSRRVKEYVIEHLEPLTEAELKELGQRQLSQRSIDE